MSRSRDMARRNKRLASYADEYGWRRVRTTDGWVALLPTGGGYCPLHGVTDFYTDEDREQWDRLHEVCDEQVSA